MISIDNLNLRLPAGFESRANNIAQQTARYLSRYPVMQSISVDNLNVPGITVHGGEANGVIARRIAQTIYHAINQQINNRAGADSNGN